MTIKPEDIELMTDEMVWLMNVVKKNNPGVNFREIARKLHETITVTVG